MIVKIQRPVYPPNATILAYDKDRRFVMNLEPTPAILKALGDDYKGYFEIKRVKGGIKIVRRVPAQAW